MASWWAKMTIKRRNEITYYVRNDVITVQYRKQYIAFNSYGLHNKKRFREFSEEILDHTQKYNNLNSLFGLAVKYRLTATKGSKPC